MNDLFLKLPQKRVAFDTAYNMQKDNLDAFDYAMGLEDISATEIVKINNIVNNSNVDKVEGFKKTNNDIFGASFTPVDKKMVPREIQKLLFEYKNGFGEEILDPNEPGISYDEKVNRIYKIFEREAKFHIIFERIHPFNDGNGRTGRILMNYNLLKQGIAPVLITNFMSRDYKKYIQQDKNTSKLCKSYSEFQNCESDNYMTDSGCIKCKERYFRTNNNECSLCDKVDSIVQNYRNESMQQIYMDITSPSYLSLGGKYNGSSSKAMEGEIGGVIISTSSYVDPYKVDDYYINTRRVFENLNLGKICVFQNCIRVPNKCSPSPVDF